jgi:hypothetical protein
VDIRFLLDEHLRGQLSNAIDSHNQRGVYPLDVLRVGDHVAAGRHLPGLFLIRPLSPLPQIVDFLVAAAHASEPSDWADVWRLIP